MGTIAAAGWQVARLLGAGDHGLAYGDDSGAFGVSGTDCADLNLSIAWDVPSAELVAALKQWTGPMVCLAVGQAEPAFPSVAASLGLTDAEASLPIWRCEPSASATRVDAVDIVKVEDEAALAQCRRVLVESFGLERAVVDSAFPDESLRTPGLAWFTAIVSGEVVSCVATVIDDGDGSLWCGGTVPAHRQRGIFTWLLAEAIRLAGNGDVRHWWAITEAEASSRAMARLGAKEVAAAHVWLRGASVGEMIADQD